MQKTHINIGTSYVENDIQITEEEANIVNLFLNSIDPKYIFHCYYEESRKPR